MPNYNIDLQNNNTDLQKILDTINTLPEAGNGGEQATPEISINNNTGLITAIAGTKSSTYQMAFQPAKTITPNTASQIVVSSGYYTGGDIIVAGDANLKPENIIKDQTIFGITGTAETGGSGNTSIEDSLMDGTVKTYTNNRVTSLTSGAFYRYLSLTTANFGACTTIKNSVFYNCTSLTSVSFPVCTSIGSSAFYNCALKSVSFPACKTVYNYAFYNCKSLASANFSQATRLYQNAFQDCIALENIDCTNLTSMGNAAFQKCYSLLSFTASKLATIGEKAFDQCRNFHELYLENSTVCTLANSNAFASTPYAGYSAYFSGTPYIYVPSSLVTAYQSATNWTYLSSYFSAIEDMEV